MENYDLVVIGSGPAGEKAAVKAAYFKYKVALIEKAAAFGGAATQEAIPAKVLKEITLYLSGKVERQLYGQEQFQRSLALPLFIPRARTLSVEESKEVKRNLNDHGVACYQGEASFESAHIVHIEGEEKVSIYGEKILIATGSVPSIQFPSAEVDGKRIHNVKTILNIERFPTSLCIVGMGISGCEYGSIFSLVGTKVFFVNHHQEVLPTFDQDGVKFFLQELKNRGIEILYDHQIASIDIPADDLEPLKITFRSGKILHVDMLMYAFGRVGNIQRLKLENAGVVLSKAGAIEVDQHYRTNVKHIYAAGDVVSKIRLANIAMDQGRVAVGHMFNISDMGDLSENIPYGMYAVPEVACVGLTEEQAKKEGLDYGIGIAYYSDTARGKFLGIEGLVKLVFNKSDCVILGVHITGMWATEFIHYGVSILREKKTLYFLISEPFNYPTLHEIYKYAAFDGLSMLTGYRLKKHRFEI